jgi:hypothetical protein
MKNPWTGEDPDRGLELLDETLEAVLERVTEGRLAVVEVVKQGWAEVVGPADADSSQPVRLDKGVLLVEVANGATASKLRLRQTKIKDALEQLLGPGEIAQMKFRVRRSQRPTNEG